MTLETADLLAIAGIVLPLLLAVMGGTLAWLKSDIRDLRTEIHAVDSKVDALTQTLLASALAHSPLTASPAAGAASTTVEAQNLTASALAPSPRFARARHGRCALGRVAGGLSSQTLQVSDLLALAAIIALLLLPIGVAGALASLK